MSLILLQIMEFVGFSFQLSDYRSQEYDYQPRIPKTSHKPILDRLLRHDSSMRHAAALAFLAFDATKASVTDVDFPIDVIVAESKSGKSYYRRFPEESLQINPSHSFAGSDLARQMQSIFVLGISANV